MDLRQLQAFLAVVDHGGFTAAAKATHTVQSNISTHVARLERELDATLIDRATGRPTQEGEAVLVRVRRIQNELSSLESDVSSMRGSPRGLVRVSSSASMGASHRAVVPITPTRTRPRGEPRIEETSDSSELSSFWIRRTRTKTANPGGRGRFG
ncbi:MAG: LysR family transcriptional regulator, partial [Actinomycetota bacterium]